MPLSSDRYYKEFWAIERRKVMDNQTLAEQVWNEQQIMELLGVNKKQLDYLRLEKGFPCVRLGKTIRVYLADEVLNFCKGIAERR